jgi:hypothetical protein
MKAVWSADVPGVRRLTLRSATGTAQRAILTGRDIGLTAVAPKRRYIAARRRKVRPISDHGNGNESIGKRHADQLRNDRQKRCVSFPCSSRGDEAHHSNSESKIPNSEFEMSILTSAPTVWKETWKN